MFLCVYLGKKCLARPRWPVHQDVSIETMVLPGVAGCYGNVTYTFLQRRLHTNMQVLLPWVAMETTFSDTRVISLVLLEVSTMPYNATPPFLFKNLRGVVEEYRG